MPIEIREMLIRAFVGGQDKDEKKKDGKDKQKAGPTQETTAKDTLAAIKQTMNREKER